MSSDRDSEGAVLNMHTQVIKFGSDRDHAQFMLLYQREWTSKFTEERIDSFEAAFRSLENKEFLGPVQRIGGIGGAILFKVSEKGKEFTSETMPDEVEALAREMGLIEKWVLENL